jgi:nitronate monooxygenase
MVLHTPVCDVLGIEVPILSVGFGHSAVPELAAAVSNAGGCGILGIGRLPPPEVHAQIARTRVLTSKPFGANVIIAAFEDPAASEERRAARREVIEIALAERVAVLVLFWGDPAPWIEPAHRSGTKVLIQVGSAAEAERAAAGGVDAVIAQGVEAGGHVRATESLWTVLPEAVRRCGNTPVLASGGIADGAGIARAFSLGAQGVSLGTRFVASAEAWAHPRYKQRIVDARSDDTIYTQDLYDVGWRNAPHRTLKNRTFERWDEAGRPPRGARPGEGEVIGTLHFPWADQPWHRYEVGMAVPTFDGDVEDGAMWAGLSVDVIGSVKPAAEIVRDLVRETEEALAATAH